MNPTTTERGPSIDTVVAALFETRKALLKEGEMLWMQKEKSPQDEQRMQEIALIVREIHNNVCWCRSQQPMEADNYLNSNQ